MSVLTVILAVLFFTALGAAYVWGYDAVKARAPHWLPQFCLLMTAIRMLLVATAIGLYVGFAEERQDAVHFALMVMGLYAVMMVVTLSLRH